MFMETYKGFKEELDKLSNLLMSKITLDTIMSMDSDELELSMGALRLMNKAMELEEETVECMIRTEEKIDKLTSMIEKMGERP